MSSKELTPPQYSVGAISGLGRSDEFTRPRWFEDASLGAYGGLKPFTGGPCPSIVIAPDRPVSVIRMERTPLAMKPVPAYVPLAVTGPRALVRPDAALILTTCGVSGIWGTWMAEPERAPDSSRQVRREECDRLAHRAPRSLTETSYRGPSWRNGFAGAWPALVSTRVTAT